MSENEGLENRVTNEVMNTQFSFSIKDMKWVITSAVALILWVVTAVLWVKSSDAQADKISTLEIDNGSLKIEVATLKGQIEGVNLATQEFMQNPPSKNAYRLDLIEGRVNRLELPGSNTPIDNSSLLEDTTHTVRRTR